MGCSNTKSPVYWLELTSRLNIIKRGVFILFALFTSITTSVADSSYMIVNDGIISDKVSQKVESLGNELYEKTKVSVYVAVTKSLEKQNIQEYEQKLAKNLKEPYILLTLAQEEKKVDIVYSEILKESFDKESVLSPFPWDGTIIPLLTVKKDNDNYNAAILNGYADIVEQISKSHNVKLEGALGSTNKNLYHYVKIGIYGFLLFVILRYFFKIIRRKK